MEKERWTILRGHRCKQRRIFKKIHRQDTFQEKTDRKRPMNSFFFSLIVSLNYFLEEQTKMFRATRKLQKIQEKRIYAICHDF